LQQGTGYNFVQKKLEIMSKRKPKSLSELIAGQDSPLGNLASKALLRDSLGDYLGTHLPPGLVDGFLHCNLQEETTLIVIATSPEWASRLRFENNHFIRLCAAQGTKINSVKVKVSSGV
jgi:hypothetical protein